jgi:hypothetical protein
MLDDDLRTLPIRCGSDSRQTLAEAGFAGDFLENSDPLCKGPVPDVPDLTAVRARYLVKSYGWFKCMTEAQIATRLRDVDRHMTEPARYDRVMLWSASSGPIPTPASLWSARTTAAGGRLRRPRPSVWIN